MFQDDKAKANYALSGKAYMVHGSDSEKARILKALASYDFSMVSVLPIPEEFSATVDVRLGKGCSPSHLMADIRRSCSKTCYKLSSVRFLRPSELTGR